LVREDHPGRDEISGLSRDGYPAHLDERVGKLDDSERFVARLLVSEDRNVSPVPPAKTTGYDFVVTMPAEPYDGELWVTVGAPTVDEQQRRADITFDRLAAADPKVALTLIAEDDSVVRRRPVTRTAQRSTAPF
jgi:hypothetical protein